MSLLSAGLVRSVLFPLLLATLGLYPRLASAVPLPWPFFPPDYTAEQIAQHCIDLQADLTQRMIAVAFDLEAAAARYEELYPTVRGDADSEITLENGAVFPNPAVDASNPERFLGDPSDPNTAELARLIDDLQALQAQLSGLHSMYAVSVVTCQEEISRRSPQQQEPPGALPNL